MFMQEVTTMPIRARIKVLLAEVNLERTRRGEKPISVRQLAEDTGITHSALVQLVNGKSKMVAFETLDKLMQFFGVNSLDRLLEYVPPAERGGESEE
jgi:DNA-binding Xre family transcriptional regulator